jgi:hypothetical protein
MIYASVFLNVMLISSRQSWNPFEKSKLFFKKNKLVNCSDCGWITQESGERRRDAGALRQLLPGGLCGVRGRGLWLPI